MSASQHPPHDPTPGQPNRAGMSEADMTDMDENPWIFHGIVAGVVGASVIAVFFLVADFVEGHPFWTPAALGNAVFLGKILEPGQPIQPAIVAAFSVLHGAAFVSGGLAASFALLGHRRQLGPLSGLALAGVLFVAFEAFFLAFFLTFANQVAPGLISELGGGTIATANLLAAAAMAAVLLSREPYRG